MNLELDTLIISSFKSFEHAVLNPKDLEYGVHFVRGKNLTQPRLGSNGSGKSSIFGAIMWCWFGKTVEGLRNPDIKPWLKFKDDPQVSTTLKIDNKKHTIRRSTQTNGLSLDGKQVGQEQVDQLLGMSFELASHTILMGQSRPLFFDLRPQAKMDLLSEAMNLERWEGRSKAAGAACRELELRLQNLVGELTGAKALQDEITDLISDTKTKIKDWDSREQVDLDKISTELVHKKKRLEIVKKDHAKFDLAYDGAETELRALKKKISELHQKKREAMIDVDRYNRLQTELKALNKSKNCPTCGQPIAKNNLADHKTELQTELTLYQPALVNVSIFDQMINTSIAAENKFQNKSNRAKDDLSHVNKEIAELEAAIKELSKGLDKKQKEENPYNNTLADLRKRLAEAKGQIELCEKRTRIAGKNLERNHFWVKGFKDVRLYIIEDFLQELQMTTNAMLQEVGLIDWEVSYEIEKETKSGTTQRGLNVMIQSPEYRNPVRWESWSGGEGQRLRIVSALALSDVLLNQVGVSPNFEILDEPSRGLSSQGISDLCEFLEGRAKDQEKVIFFVDHTTIESARFESVITVTKQNGVSNLKIAQ